MLGQNFQANRQNRNRAYYNFKDNEAVSYNSDPNLGQSIKTATSNFDYLR